MAKPQEFRWTHRIPVARAKLWCYVSDTEMLNRLAGLFDVRYEYTPLATGGSEVHAFAKAKGIKLHWIEQPTEWVEPEYFVFTRDFVKGPLKQIISRVDLADDGAGGTNLTHMIRVTPRNPLGTLMAKVGVGAEARKGFARAYDLAAAWATDQREFERRTRAAHERDDVRRQAASVLDPLGKQLAAPELAARLAEHLATRPDEELADLRPYRLATQWGADRRDALKLFLHAAKGGLLNTHYSLICPGCRRAKTSFTALRDVAAKGHCPSCNIDFGVDFDRSIEVTFSPARIDAEAVIPNYCHSGPGNTPHRVAVWVIKAGETRVCEATVTAGKHQIMSLQCKGGVFCDVAQGGQSAAMLTMSKDGIAGVPPTLVAGRVTLTAENRTGLDAELMVVRAAWADDVVSAADLTAMQEFRSLFSSEVLAPGAEFSIRNMVFLFSDLVGSTSMYEKIGDATAFALVRNHFDLLRDIYTRHDGALVKTIGDAVMAVFRNPADALDAALEMHERIPTVRDARTGVALRLRIGLHVGPCIAMEANGMLDYFGTTVNMAARVQGLADGGQTALSNAMLADPAVQRIMTATKGRIEQSKAELKGLSGRFDITRVTTGA